MKEYDHNHSITQYINGHLIRCPEASRQHLGNVQEMKNCLKRGCEANDLHWFAGD